MRTIAASWLLMFMLVAGGLGCGITYKSNVESLVSDRQISGKRVDVVPLNKDLSSGSLEFQEYRSMLLRAIAPYGYVPATNGEAADVVLLLYVNVSDPNVTTSNVTVPTYGTVGGGTTYYNGTVTNNRGYAGSYSGTSYTPGQFGVTGYQSFPVTTVLYFRFVNVTALDGQLLREQKRPEELWKTTITSVGSSGSLREVFPYMLAAAKGHWASRTNGTVAFEVNEHDETARDIVGAEKK